MDDHDTNSADPTPDAIRAQLEHILVSDVFANAPMLSRFLRHVVEHRLREDPSPLKEFALGVDVFDRGADFDPRTDTIVRVNARRLRSRLATYYQTQGRHDPIVIEMPKGHYVVVFHDAPEVAAPPPGEAVSHKRRAGDNDATTAAESPARPLTLPAARTPLVGREQLLANILGLLSQDTTRLLTLTGTGGSGKTRLALEAAWKSIDNFPGGILFIDLAAVANADGFVRAVAQVFAVRRTRNRPLDEAITEHLRQAVKAPMLLVLDNLEQLAPHTGLVGTLLDASAALKILATSRVALHVYGEHAYLVEPLTLPGRDPLPPLEALAQNEAVRLFLARAGASNPHYRLTAENAAAIAELCCRLDGLPLPIELVAARARELTPAAMLERFSGHLDLPAHAAHDLPARQRTLRRTVDWSYALLDPREQVLLRRLAVFTGGFTAEAAEAVADAAGDLGLDIEDGLTALVDNNLLYLAATQPETRYAKLVTIRAYTLERLSASRDEALVRRAHAAYMLVLAEEGNGAENGTPQRETWLARCDLEQSNFRAALDGLLERGDIHWALRMGQSLFAYWERREHLAEGRRYLQAILERCSPDTDPALRARVEYQVAMLVAFQGDIEASADSYRRLLDTFRQLGDRQGEATALTALGVAAKNVGDNANAAPYFEQALEAYRELGVQAQIAAALSNLAGVVMGDDPDRARLLLEESRRLFSDLGHPVSATWCVNHLADVARAHGDYPLAERLYREAETEFRRMDVHGAVGRSLTDLGHLSLQCDRLDQARIAYAQALDIFSDIDYRRGVARLLDGCMRLAIQRNDGASALRLAGAAQMLRRTVEAVPNQKDQVVLDRLLSQAQHGLDPETARQFQDAGLGMSYEQAIALAHAALEGDRPASLR